MENYNTNLEAELGIKFLYILYTYNILDRSSFFIVLTELI